jgi:cold shock CspA family protein
MTRPAATTGVVIAFDVPVGLGTVRSADGVEVGFHCTQIADGSRDIAVGTSVEFVVLAGRHGCWEAGAIRPRRGE